MAGATVPQQQKFSAPVRCDVYTVTQHISSNNTNYPAILNGPGALGAVIINTKGATGNLLTLYDSLTASGTVIAVIDTTAAVGTLTYNVAVTNGLSANLATGTPADITVVAR